MDTDTKKTRKKGIKRENDISINDNDINELMKKPKADDSDDTSKKDTNKPKSKDKNKKRDKKKKDKKEEKSEEEENTGNAHPLALAYLKEWKEDHGSWKFQKVRQTWLLQNIYNTEKISDSEFSVLLEYLVDLKGKAREETVTKATTVVEKEDAAADEKARAKVDRARELIQLLT